LKISLIIAGVVLLSLNSFAGTIIASGDSDIADTVTGGNATFFSNVLGSGTKVLIQELDSGTATSGGNIASYYNGLSGVTATQTTATSVASLAGMNLFITMLPQGAYSGAEISAMSSFLSGGGTVFFIGEATGYIPGGIADPIITSTLGTLGSAMTMSGANGVDYGNAVVVPNALTAGVSNFNYVYTAWVSGGTPLFDTNPTSGTGLPFIEVQTVGGSLTPEPASEVLMLGGLAGLGLLARRKKRS
jgi:PEP-CTERM motif